jgi:hypothetical protein
VEARRWHVRLFTDGVQIIEIAVRAANAAAAWQLAERDAEHRIGFRGEIDHGTVVPAQEAAV